MSSDELAEINGIKPNVYLADGEEREVNSMSSTSVYKVKRTWDHYYCTCMAWRNQGGVPVNARSCKHLISLLGENYEAARLKLKNPHGPPLKGSKKPASKAKAPPKRKRGDDDDDGEKVNKSPKKARKPPSSARGKANAKDEDEDEDEDKGSPSKKYKKPPSSAKGGRKSKEDDEEVDDDDDEPEADAKNVPELLLANKWDLDTGVDPTGWWISEKLDGVRTFYDGKRMISRLGNPFTPPTWLLDQLPKDITLDGELFGGRGQFQSTVSIVKTLNSPHWKGITFQVFDIPSHGDKTFEERMEILQKFFGPGGSHESDLVKIVQQTLAKDRQHVLDELKNIESLGGEGLMLRKAGSLYEGRRSATLLKIKTFYDAEAVVTGYVPGKGKYKGATGALKCKMESGKNFNVGTGMSDQLRRKPPKVGTIITYRFQELTRDGVPRFPSYIGEAIDKDAPKDAEMPAHRKVGVKSADDA